MHHFQEKKDKKHIIYFTSPYSIQFTIVKIIPEIIT